MTKNDILNVIKELSYSQGSYGRLLQAILDDPESGDEFLQYIADTNPRDAVDVVLAIET